MNSIINKIDKNILKDDIYEILCEKEEDANKLLRQLHELGYMWFSKESLIKFNNFYKCDKNGIVYNIYRNNKIITYSHKDDGYTYIYKPIKKREQNK